MSEPKSSAIVILRTNDPVSTIKSILEETSKLGIQMDRIAIKEGSLEDIFIQVIGAERDR